MGSKGGMAIVGDGDGGSALGFVSSVCLSKCTFAFIVVFPLLLICCFAPNLGRHRYHHRQIGLPIGSFDVNSAALKF